MRVPRDELLRIREEQKTDVQWWGHIPSFADDYDVAEAKKSGAVVEVQDGTHYKISARANVHYRVLTPATLQLLELVSREWAAQMQQRGLDSYFLVLSSLTRPTFFQKQLAAEGRPAMPNSTHEKGFAFDFSVSWFRRYEPRASRTLEEVLRHHQRRGSLNAIDEPSVQVFHVCVSPLFVAGCALRSPDPRTLEKVP